jgi:hypothetical protein
MIPFGSALSPSRFVMGAERPCSGSREQVAGGSCWPTSGQARQDCLAHSVEWHPSRECHPERRPEGRRVAVEGSRYLRGPCTGILRLRSFLAALRMTVMDFSTATWSADFSPLWRLWAG